MDTYGFDCGLDLDLKSFQMTGFLTGSGGKIWIGLESKILDCIMDFFQPLARRRPLLFSARRVTSLQALKSYPGGKNVRKSYQLNSTQLKSPSSPLFAGAKTNSLPLCPGPHSTSRPSGARPKPSSSAKEERLSVPPFPSVRLSASLSLSLSLAFLLPLQRRPVPVLIDGPRIKELATIHPSAAAAAELRRFFPRGGSEEDEEVQDEGRRRTEEEKPPFQKERGVQSGFLPSPLHCQPFSHPPLFLGRSTMHKQTLQYGMPNLAVRVRGPRSNFQLYGMYLGLNGTTCSRKIRPYHVIFSWITVSCRALKNGTGCMSGRCTLWINLMIAKGITAAYIVTYILPSLSSGSRYSVLK